MSLEKMGQSIESNEVKVRFQATPEDVENVRLDHEKAHKITNVNNVLKVLDFPDNIEESFRKILLKQDNKTLEELAKKSKKEIQNFLLSEKETKRNQDIQKIKLVFTPQILEQNPNLAKEFNNLDKE